MKRGSGEHLFVLEIDLRGGGLDGPALYQDLELLDLRSARSARQHACRSREGAGRGGTRRFVRSTLFFVPSKVTTLVTVCRTGSTTWLTDCASPAARQRPPRQRPAGRPRLPSPRRRGALPGRFSRGHREASKLMNIIIL